MTSTKGMAFQCVLLGIKNLDYLSAITLLPAISYTPMSYSLSLFSANRDDVGLG
jgi:hypothetical protein